MDENAIQSWTTQELIKNAYHELNQRSNVALGFIRVLTEGNEHDIPSDHKEEIIRRIQNELEIIYEVVQWLRIWHAANKDSPPLIE